MHRNKNNPILTRYDIPNIGEHLIDVSSVFNPGAVKVGDNYHLMVRVQNRGRETFLMMADSKDGINFKVREEIVFLNGIEEIQDKIYHLYDPRITCIENIFYIMFAIDMKQGCRLGLAKSKNLKTFKFMGIVSKEDNRNGVIFPEKVGGEYIRLERPNITSLNGIATGNCICLSKSTDLLNWNQTTEVIFGNMHFWDEIIGSGPPPVKTQNGWILIYHGVATHFSASNIYQAGVLLLDLEEPSKVISRSKYNILEPREDYELLGQVPNVIFPSGLIVEHFDEDGYAELDSAVKIYFKGLHWILI